MKSLSKCVSGADKITIFHINFGSGVQWNLETKEWPNCQGVLVSRVNLYYKAQFETFVSVLKDLNTGVS